MMEEMQKAELERMKKQMKRGSADPWAFDQQESAVKVETETLLDKAKSFSF